MTIIPEKLYLGFCKRNEGLLAYVSYYDDKGKPHKVTSMESWRDKSIPTKDIPNVPTKGFEIVRKVGEYDWGWFDKRKAWIRISDPRGFEIEISVDNFLEILKEMDCNRGVLSGELVYSYSGAEMRLLPVGSEEYTKTMTEKSILAKSRITSKDVQVGQVYLAKNGDLMLYLGRFETYRCGARYNGSMYLTEKEALNQYFEDNNMPPNHCYKGRWYYPIEELHYKSDADIYNLIERNVFYSVGLHYYFASLNSNGWLEIRDTKAFPSNLIKHCPGEESKFDMNEINEKLENDYLLHPVTGIKYRLYSFDEFANFLKNGDEVSFFSKRYSDCSDLNYTSRFESVLLSPYVSRPKVIGLVTVEPTNKEGRYHVRWKGHYELQYTDLKAIYDVINPIEITFHQDNGREYTF